MHQRRWLPASQFQACLTAVRLADPQVDHLRFYRRIQHIPFQFKPPLRFCADQPRLFIADEVGVSKAIEAGLILRSCSPANR